MKGQAKITLIDTKTGKETNQLEDNMLTNALSNQIHSLLNMMQRPEMTSYHCGIQWILKNTTPLQSIGGIMLFENKLVEDVNNTFSTTRPIGYAGSSYDLSNPKRGSLNTQETRAFETDSKKVYRWVWDFGTANCNITFNCLALTTNTGGNGYIKDSSGSYARTTENLNYISEVINSTTFSNMNLNPKSSKAISIDGTFYQSDITNGFRKSTFNANDIEIDIKYNHIEMQIVKINGYDKFSNTIILDSNNNQMILAGKKQLDEKWYLITSDLDGNVVTSVVLTNLTIDIDYFSIANDKLIINTNLNGQDCENVSPNYNNYMKFTIYDLTNHVFIKDKKIYISYGASDMESFCYKPVRMAYGQLEPLTIKNLDKFVTIFDTGSATTSYYGGQTLLYDINMDKIDEKEGKALNFEKSNKVPYSPQAYTSSVLIGKLGTITTYHHSYFTYLTHPRTLFTINNLEEPITKTESNTMKITYELTWDK